MASTTDSKPLKKASGSLMILLIFLIVTTLLRIYTLSNMIPKLFATWNIIANPQSPLYIQGYVPLIISEIAGNTLFICAFIYALLLFYNQKRLFPKVMLILVITYPIFMTLNILMSHWVMGNLIQSDYKRLSLMLLLNIAIYLIWVPYLYYSQRVKSTFRY